MKVMDFTRCHLSFILHDKHSEYVCGEELTSKEACKNRHRDPFVISRFEILLFQNGSVAVVMVVIVFLERGHFDK